MTTRLPQFTTLGVRGGILLSGLLVIAGLSGKLGVAALALPLVALGAVWLLARPGAALLVAVGLSVVVESDAGWGPSPQLARIYEVVPGVKVTPIELLLLVAIAALALDLLATRRPLHWPRPFVAPLLVLLCGLAAGALTGRDAGAGITTIVNAGRTALPLVIVPFVVAGVVRTTPALRQAIALAGGLAAFKGVAGIAALLTGMTSASIDGRGLTYYAAPANFLLLLALLFAVAAPLARERIPLWLWAAMPFIVASLLYSYRRSFWIAAVLGILLVVLVGAGRSWRRVGLPALLVSGLAAYLLVAGGVAGQLASPAANESSLAGRLQSINPTKISNNAQDRYRLDERRNVLADLRAAPISGIGLGIDYTQRYPLGLSNITHQYVHFAALWWWMKLGILGLIGYVWMMAAAIAVGLRVWAGHPDRLVRTGGLASAAGVVGLAVAETSGTFTGADQRFSIIFGALLGLLAVAYAGVERGARPALAPE
jgi:hypothetical protein